MPAPQITLRELFKIVTAGAILFACMSFWHAGGILLGCCISAAYLLWPNNDDENWTIRYVGSNAMITVAIMLGAIASLFKICVGR